MGRRFLIAFLALGAVAGFGSAIFHRAHHRGDFERHVADICAESALRAAGKSNVSAPAPR